MNDIEYETKGNIKQGKRDGKIVVIEYRDSIISKDKINQIFNTIPLERLEIINCELEVIPKDILELKNLKVLNLEGNKIKKIPVYLLKLKDLEVLNFSSNKDISEIPKELFNLKRLRSLNFSDTNIDIEKLLVSLEENIPFIEELYLDENNIETISSIIFNLKNLKVLSLTDNNIKEIPDKIEALKSLEILDLRFNKINKISKKIMELDLNELFLKNNPFLIFEELENSDLKKSLNELFNIHEHYAKFKKIDLSGLNLVNIPNLSHFKDVEILDLSRNNIRENIDKKSKKIILDVTKLLSLKELDLSSNDIQNIPKDLSNLVNLQKLNLANNPISQVKGFSLIKSPKDVIDFLLDMQGKKDMVSLNEAKLLIVGDENVGKSSLVKRLIYPNAKFDESYRSTKGIDIKRYKISDYTLNIWDFAGQEITYQVHNLFMSKESLYLLVLDGQKEDNQTDTLDWLETISSNADNPPIIIVINKSDFNRGYKVNEKLYRDRFENIKDVVYTSAKEDTGLDKLRKTILQRVETLKGIHEKFAKEYDDVNRCIKILARKQYILEANEFDKNCQKFNICSRKEKRNLRISLNEIGTIIGFQDDDMHVINPRWILKILYEIIRSKAITDKAEFNLNNLEEIMNNEDYSDRHYTWIIDFLIENKIALKVEQNKIMIPSRLPVNSPDEFLKENYEKVNLEYGLNFRYRYMRRFKKSILFNFIIQMQKYIVKDEPRYWANGVFLEYKGVKVVVLSSKIYKKIDIHIPINTEESRELFQKIKYTLDNLSQGDWDIETDGDVHREIAIVHEDRIKRYKNYDFLRNKRDLGATEVEIDIWRKPVKRRLSDLLDRYENMENFILIEKEKKQSNFEDGLKEFLIEYDLAINNPSDFKRHAENCGNQARKIGEAFCRYIILDSNKSENDKIKAIKKLLFNLTKIISEEENQYIIEKHDRNTIKGRLDRLRNIGNPASHDNEIITNQFDLDEIKNNLLYFENYLFGDK